MDIEPSVFEDVFALSAGNPLFVVEHLLRDPFYSDSQRLIRRVIGNVGKAGLSLLISPREPDVKGPELEQWAVVAHAEFDGKMEMNFEETTLHLSFTGYELPVVTEGHGSRRQEVTCVEAVLSAYDQGDWVADLNILDLMRGSSSSEGLPANLWFVPFAFAAEPRQWDSSSLKIGPLISIDNWSEFLDPPRHTAIARATGNWLARIALTAVALHMRINVILLPELEAHQDERRIDWMEYQMTARSFKASEPRARVLMIA